jgi:hypothetical protein
MHADWQKQRRFALQLLPAGDLQRYALQNYQRVTERVINISKPMQ